MCLRKLYDYLYLYIIPNLLMILCHFMILKTHLYIVCFQKKKKNIALSYLCIQAYQKLRK